MLSHLLAAEGIHSVIVAARSRTAIEETIRAGVLEPGAVDLLVETGVGARALAEGARHDGIELRFGGEGHRIDFAGLVGRSVWLYPQHEVLNDLISARLKAGADIRFEASDVSVRDVTSEAPSIAFTDADGSLTELRCDVIAGCDGSAGISKWAIPDTVRADYFRAYPFGWFGILVEVSSSWIVCRKKLASGGCWPGSQMTCAFGQLAPFEGWSSTVSRIPRAAASRSSMGMVGMVPPASNRATAGCFKPARSASCACVSPNSSRRRRTVSPSSKRIRAAS